MNIRKLVAFMAALICFNALAADEHLNIYNWSDYIADDTISQFEKKTGIKVRYDVYDSNDTLQAKLLAGSSGYDIVVPTSNYAGRQLQAQHSNNRRKIYQPLDKTMLPNLKYLDKNIMDKLAEIDPHNQYAVPWVFGTTGLGYQVEKVQQILGKKASLDNWDNLFDPNIIAKLKQCGVSMLDAPDQVFAATLHYMGRNPSSEKLSDYEDAYLLLKKIRPYITQFSSSTYINELVGGDICFAYGWSGDITIAKHRARQAKKPYRIHYAIPKGGAPVWFDLMMIPRDAPHSSTALAWINFSQDPEINAAITNKVFYPSANFAAKKFIQKEVVNDPGVYPPAKVVKTLFPLKSLSPEITRKITRLWTQFKTGK